MVIAHHGYAPEDLDDESAQLLADGAEDMRGQRVNMSEDQAPGNASKDADAYGATSRPAPAPHGRAPCSRRPGSSRRGDSDGGPPGFGAGLLVGAVLAELRFSLRAWRACGR